MADVVREGVLKLRVEVDGGNTGDIESILKSTRKVTDETDKLKKKSEELGAAVKRRNDDWSASLKKVQEQQDRVQESTREMLDGNKQLLAASKAVGDGALTAARSLALAGAAGSNSMAELVETLGAVQSAMDAWRGTLDIAQGAVDIFAAMNVRRKAMIATTNIHTAATNANTAALVAQGKAAKGAGIAMALSNPIILAVAAALAVAAFAYTRYAGAAKKAREEEERLQKIEQKRLQSRRENARAAAQTARELRVQSVEIGASGPVGLGELRGDIQSARNLNTSGSAARSAVENATAGITKTEDAMAKLETANRLAKASLDIKKQEVAQENEKRRLQVEEIRNLQQSLNLAEQKRRAAEAANQATASSLSSMNASEQQAVFAAIEKAQAGGTLNREQLSQIKGLAGSNEDINRIVREQERRLAEPGLRRLNQLGIDTDQGASALRDEEKRLQGQLNETTGGKTPAQAIAELKKANEDAIEEQMKLQRQTEEFARDSLEVMVTLSGRLKSLKDSLADATAQQEVDSE